LTASRARSAKLVLISFTARAFVGQLAWPSVYLRAIAFASSDLVRTWGRDLELDEL
jgi:hypothetical protein